LRQRKRDRERETEREREREKGRERQRQKESMCVRQRGRKRERERERDRQTDRKVHGIEFHSPILAPNRITSSIKEPLPPIGFFTAGLGLSPQGSPCSTNPVHSVSQSTHCL
jgi:hypothetical protein